MGYELRITREFDGYVGSLYRGRYPSEVKHFEIASESRKVPLSAASTADSPSQPGMGDRHITYTAVGCSRVFVIAVIDLFSRLVLASNVVNTMDAGHCIDTLEMTLLCYGRPEIFNSDQGSQFTSRDKGQKDNGTKISKDVKWISQAMSIFNRRC